MLGSGREHQAQQQGRPDDGFERSARRVRPESLASAIGNRAFASMIGRSETGVMPGGTVHPDIAATIGRMRGGGAPLDSTVRERFAPQLGDSLSDVRVHADAGADTLARDLSARAFTTGSDMFFAAGEYRPGSSDGDRLIAHELTHVVQQRAAPTSGAMIVPEPRDASEVEAESLAREMTD